MLDVVEVKRGQDNLDISRGTTENELGEGCWGWTSQAKVLEKELKGFM